MSVNPKEKKMLQELWNKAEMAGGIDIPDGTYQFEILSARFHMTEKGKPTFKTKLKVSGGDEDYIGKEFEINDNLETVINQGFFKRKLRKLNITVPEDFNEIIDGDLADEMEGKVFEGQVATKNDFVNVYVQRLISDNDGEERSSKKEAKEDVEEKEENEENEESKESSNEISEGDEVTWGDGKSGKVVEILEDDGKARVELEDETIVRVKLDLLKKGEVKKEEEDEESEDEESETFELPSADDVEGMKAADVRKALESLSFDPSDLKDARGVLHSFCTLAEDKDAKIELSEVAPLAAALEITFKKDAAMKDRLKALAKAVHSRLG